ncbi:MAG: hypothetical protein ACYTFK_13090 [Planctomycetota bacterium]|jgi:uncharacterized membrane protein
MTTKYFSFSDVLGYGWRVTKANFGFFVGIGVVFIIAICLPEIARIIVQNLHLPKAYNIAAVILIQILGWLISIILGIGLIKIALSFCDERKPTFGTLFDAADCFWRYLGAGILYLLIVYAGFVLLIVPGIIWAIKFSLCYYFVVDKGLGPIDALKASSRTTMGVKGELFGFGIVCGLINMLGLLCLLVGIFATYPVVIVANALVYRQLMAQTLDLAEFGIGQAAPSEDIPTLPANENL